MNDNQKLLTTIYQQVRGVQGTADFHMSMAVAYQRLMDELSKNEGTTALDEKKEPSSVPLFEQQN